MQRHEPVESRMRGDAHVRFGSAACGNGADEIPPPRRRSTALNRFPAFLNRVRGDDTGGMGIFSGILMLGIIVLLMVVWDAGSQVRTMQRADNVAAQAARAAGQQIDLDEAIAGGEKRVDPVRAQEAAHAYLASAGATGTVTFSPDLRQITVDTSLPYQPTFGGLPYRGPVTISGHATAQLITG